MTSVDPSVKDLQRARAILQWAGTQLPDDKDLRNIALMREWLGHLIEIRRLENKGRK